MEWMHVAAIFSTSNAKENNWFLCQSALTRVSLTSCVSVVLLHTAVLIQRHYESGWQSSQFQMLWAVQMAYQRVLSS